MAISKRDLEVLQKTLLALHVARDLESFRAEVPKLLRGAIRADLVTWVEFSFGSSKAPGQDLSFWEDPARTSPEVMRRQMTIVNEHPFSRHAVATGNWGPLRLSDFVTDRQLKATAHWRDVYRHNNVGRVIAFALFRGNRCGTLNLTRPLGDEDFSKRDMQMLALIAPHFHLALGSSEMATMRGDERAHVLLALGLTTREVEVAKWLSRGRTNQEIAAILEMKPRTVEKHVENMLVKLGVENRTTAAMVVAGIVGTAPGPAPPAAATYFDKPRRGRN